jgi:upstream activation factor subunit UAF30
LVKVFNQKRKSIMATAKKAPAKKALAKKAAPAKKAAAPAKKAVAKKAAHAKKAAPVKKAPVKAAKPAKKTAAKRTPNAAFMKALTPSDELAAVVGSTPLARTAVVSKLWDYIKKHDLQDKANKRNINADAKLKLIFGKPQVSMFELAALIGKHVK